MRKKDLKLAYKAKIATLDDPIEENFYWGYEDGNARFYEIRGHTCEGKLWTNPIHVTVARHVFDNTDAIPQMIENKVPKELFISLMEEFYILCSEEIEGIKSIRSTVIQTIKDHLSS